MLKPGKYMFGGFDVGGPWSIDFAEDVGIKCYAILSGSCWLEMDGEPASIRLEEGDCVLLARGRPFRITTDQSMPPVDFETAYPRPLRGQILTVNGGGDLLGVGGYFELAGNHSDILLGSLPPVVHIQKQSDRTPMRWAMQELMRELREPQPGGVLVAEHLLQMILLQVLRLHLASGAGNRVGWLFALADAQMSTALYAIHGEPAHRWTLAELAELANMSRSTFAVKFKALVGTAPMDYLTRWRMLLAGERLRNSRDSVADIALSIGYESESAFSTAFKRVMGCPPRRYVLAAADGLGIAV